LTGKFFDELARTLATPMPRRKAVQIIGGAVAAAAVPAFKAAEAHANPNPLRLGAFRPTEGCGGVCTAPKVVCGFEVTSKTGNVGCNVGCCHVPGDKTTAVCCNQNHATGSWCCPEEYRCGDGTGTGQGNCIHVCPPNRNCDHVCCPKGEVCRNGKICCKESQSACGANCCDANEECINLRVGPTTAKYCAPRCPKKRSRCGPRCCPKGEKCIDDRGICAKCDKGKVACGKKCCNKSSTFCCDPAKNLCCKNDKESCCPVGGTSESTAPKRTCCAKPNKCARELPAEIGGLTKSSKYVCCPPKRQVPVDETRPKDIVACCAPGQVSLGGKLVVGTGIQGMCCAESQVCGSGKNITCCQKFSEAIGTDLDQTCCGGNTCVSLNYDNQNCGACGKTCAAGTRCQKGVCVAA
jgi:hypothetical protein